MLDYSYIGVPFAQITKLAEFYKDSVKLPETVKIKSMIGSIRGILKIPQTKILLNVAQGARIYRFDILSPKSTTPNVIAAIYYLPLVNRVDLFDYMISPDIPLIQWKNKKAVSMGCSMLSSLAGFDRLFQQIILSS